MRRSDSRLTVSLVFGLALSACQTLPISAPEPSAPFFTPTPKDTAALADLTRELNAMAAHCADPHACDQVHYAKGMVALFESREAARMSFRRVQQTSFPTPMAASSALWLQLLDGDGRLWMAHEPKERAFLDITAQLVREWINRKLVEFRELKKSGVAAAKPAPLMDEAALVPRQKPTRSSDGEAELVQSLQKQMKEREARIRELSLQLETLKAIDRDVDERKKVPRPPAVLTPTGIDHAR